MENLLFFFSHIPSPHQNIFLGNLEIVTTPHCTDSYILYIHIMCSYRKTWCRLSQMLLGVGIPFIMVEYFRFVVHYITKFILKDESR